MRWVCDDRAWGIFGRWLGSEEHIGFSAFMSLRLFDSGRVRMLRENQAGVRGGANRGAGGTSATKVVV